MNKKKLKETPKNQEIKEETQPPIKDINIDFTLFKRCSRVVTLLNKHYYVDSI